MFFNKKKKEKLKKDEYREKFLKQNSNEETTKINMKNFDLNSSELDLAYERYNSLSTKDLKFKLENEVLTTVEKNIIKKIISGRQ